MNILAVLLLGLLIGWLIEWGIDWFYWRARMQAIIDKNSQHAGLEKMNSVLEEENAILMREHKNKDEENSALKDHLADLQDEIDRLKAAAIIGALLDERGNQNLQAIKGIGPAFSKRLNDAGVQTFDHLARLTPKDMEIILGTLYQRFFSKENTIREEASEFARHLATFKGTPKA